MINTISDKDIENNSNNSNKQIENSNYSPTKPLKPLPISTISTKINLISPHDLSGAIERVSEEFNTNKKDIVQSFADMDGKIITSLSRDEFMRQLYAATENITKNDIQIISLRFFDGSVVSVIEFIEFFMTSTATRQARVSCRCMCLCVCMHTCVCMCMYAYLCVYVLCVSTCAYLCMCAYLSMFVQGSVVVLHVVTCLYLCVCMYVCIYM